ncbi:MAG: putative glycosyl transferase group 1 [Candidatus Saccharibacteria bacterium]|nr:putative glycosyl transferase group 1 [Candidatus Saccharibacteria bacterium]
MNKQKLSVLFDANPLVAGQKSGVGYYTYQLIDALAKNYPDELMLVGHYFNFLGRKNPDLPDHPNIKYKTSVLLPGKVLSVARRLGLQLPFDILIKSRGDIALFPNFVSLPMIQKAKKAVVIHDLCFEDFPQYLQEANRSFLQRFVPHSVKKADVVITISESTKEAILKHYNIDPKNILITPIPPAEPIKEKAPRPQDIELPKKYILFMSTLEPRKNFINLVKAYSLLPRQLKHEYGLVLAGGNGWETEEAMANIKRLQGEGENIVVAGYVSDDTRTYLYQNASLLVMPSHYEGFGMPILEAMSYGVPAAVSDIPVFHEVAGNAAAYFDKDDVGSIATSIENVLRDDQAIKNNMGRQLEKYNWDSVAFDVMASFKKVTGKINGF